MIINLAHANSPLHPAPGDDVFGASIIAVVCAVGLFFALRMIFRPNIHLEKRQNRLERQVFGDTFKNSPHKKETARLALWTHLNVPNPSREVQSTGWLLAVFCIIGEFAVWKFVLYDALFN